MMKQCLTQKDIFVNRRQNYSNKPFISLNQIYMSYCTTLVYDKLNNWIILREM